MNARPVRHDLGTYQLGDRMVPVVAVVTIAFETSGVPPGEHGRFLEDVLPKAMAVLRTRLSRLEWRAGAFVDGSEES